MKKSKITWPIEFNTRRLTIRNLKKTDYAQWFKAYDERMPSQNQHDLGRPDMKLCTKAEFLKKCRNQLEIAKADKVYIFSIFLKKTGEHLGAVDIATIQRDSMQWANLGYALHNQFWGNGYAKEATTACLKTAFTKLHFHRIEAVINTKNKASIKLAKALKMQREGVRKQFFYEFGEWCDNVVYSAHPEDVGLRSKPPIIQ